MCAWAGGRKRPEGFVTGVCRTTIHGIKTNVLEDVVLTFFADVEPSDASNGDIDQTGQYHHSHVHRRLTRADAHRRAHARVQVQVKVVHPRPRGQLGVSGGWG